MIFAHRLRRAARLLRCETLRQRLRPREPRRVPDRDLDPDLLPRDPAQVRLRGAARLVADHRPAGRPHRRRSPDGFYVLDGIITLNPEAAWDAVEHLILPAIALGSIPLAIIARITRAVRARRPERGLRAHGAGEGHVVARSSTAATSSATRCCPWSRSSACRPGSCSPARSSPRRCSRIPGMGRGSRGRSTTATTPCSRAGSCSSRSSSCSSTCSSTSRTGFLDPRIRVS